jgi:hypothetical protein
MAQVIVAPSSKIDLLDLEPYKWKLSRKYPTISPEDFEILDLEYRRFLLLKTMYPNTKFSPTRNMDEMWHQHILDTSNYRKNCQQLFGKFLDHRPYFGPHSPEGLWESMSDKFDTMEEIYTQVFGESPSADLDIFIEKAVRRSFCNDGGVPGETCDEGDGCE